MSKPIDDGGPAFPQPITYHPITGEPQVPSNGWGLGGVSAREYFAAHAAPLDQDLSLATIAELTGLELPPPMQEGETKEQRFARNVRWLMEADTRYRYMQADAMLAERKRGGAS